MQDPRVLDWPWSAARLDADGIIVATSAAWDAFSADNGGPTGPGVAIGRSYLAASASAPEAVEAVRAVLTGERDDATFVYPCHAPNELRWFRAHVRTCVDGAIVLHIGISLDERVPDAMPQTRLGLVELDIDLAARHVDSAWAATRGVDIAEDLGDQWWAGVAPDDQPRLTELLRTLGTRRAAVMDTAVTHLGLVRNGIRVPARVEATVHRNDHGEPRGYVVVFRDGNGEVSSPTTAAVHRVTGLVDRSVLLAHLRLSIAQGERTGLRTAVLMIDLDGFRQVNDDHGRGVGDRVLQAIAGRLADCLGPADLLVRLGGDEMVAVLADLPSIDPAEETCQRIRRELARPLDAGGTRLVGLTASIGLAVAADGEEPSMLLRRADGAMFAAKSAGGDRHRRALADRLDPTRPPPFSPAALQTAWESGQLQVHFQPMVALRASHRAVGPVIAAEALLRWHHPDHGVLPAAVFIDAARRGGIIRDLSWWAIDRAISTFPVDLGLDLYLNLAGEQLADRDRIASLRTSLATAGLSDRVVVEITETVLSTDPSRVREVTGWLRAAGLRIAIDDFGSGFSSLSRLRQLPSDVLKIDGSLVRGVDRDAEARRVLDGVMALARALGVTTVGESVEHARELEVLVEAGVDVVQGHMLGAALPVERLPWTVEATFAHLDLLDDDLRDDPVVAGSTD